MATRRQIREAFYADLETAADGLVDPNNITAENPNSEEDLPALVHSVTTRDVPMNTNTGPVDTEVVDGGVEALIYSEVIDAQFSILVAGDDEQQRETIYETVRSYFGEYTYPTKDATSLHPDVNRVTVGDANPDDADGRTPRARGDRLNVVVQFERYYTRDTTPARKVSLNQSVDDVETNTYVTQ